MQHPHPLPQFCVSSHLSGDRERFQAPYPAGVGSGVPALHPEGPPGDLSHTGLAHLLNCKIKPLKVRTFPLKTRALSQPVSNDYLLSL